MLLIFFVLFLQPTFGSSKPTTHRVNQNNNLDTGGLALLERNKHRNIQRHHIKKMEFQFSPPKSEVNIKLIAPSIRKFNSINKGISKGLNSPWQ